MYIQFKNQLKASLFITCLFFGLKGHSQDYQSAIGLEVRPGIANIRTTLFDVFEMDRLAVGGGINYKYRLLGDFLYADIGFYYADMGWGGVITFTDLVGNYLEEVRFKDRFNFINMPLLVHFKYRSAYFAVGPSLNLGLSRKAFLDGEVMATYEANLPDSFSLGALAKLGYEYPLTNRVILNAEVNFSPLLNEYKYVNYGLGLGLHYQIN